ncbi:MAG: hypothetical protein ABJE95_32750 [Byssovorax sp.]
MLYEINVRIAAVLALAGALVACGSGAGGKPAGAGGATGAGGDGADVTSSAATAGGGGDPVATSVTSATSATTGTSTASGATCGDGACSGEICSSCPQDCGACPTAPFGDVDLHPAKIGFYMIPDLDEAYRAGGAVPAGAPGSWCPWTTTQASLYKLHQVLPDAWIRWDNETGHNTSSPANVETFVSCADNAGVAMILTADAADGYNNYWANQYVTGVAAPNMSLVQIADGPYLGLAHDLLVSHGNVKLVETMNEADGPWFVTDGDDEGHFNYYMDKLKGVMGGDVARIVGPAAAIKGSNLWNNYVARADLESFSYHTYDGHSGLVDVPGKKVHVTEYGGQTADFWNPGTLLADLFQAEKEGKLSGTIERIYYHQITDDGSNRGAFKHDELEGTHFAFRDWLRALILYQALGSVSTRGYLDPSAGDFLGADDGKGAFGVLVWNDSDATKSGQTRTIPGTSVNAGQTLHVVHVLRGDANTAKCTSVGEESAVHVEVGSGVVTVHIDALEPWAAVFVSTSPCAALVD